MQSKSPQNQKHQTRTIPVNPERIGFYLTEASRHMAPLLLAVGDKDYSLMGPPALEICRQMSLVLLNLGEKNGGFSRNQWTTINGIISTRLGETATDIVAVSKPGVVEQLRRAI